MKKKVKKKTSSDKANIQSGEFSARDDGLSGNRVFVSVSKTINLGNYEALRLEFGMGCTVGEGESFDPAFRRCLKKCSDELSETLKTIGDLQKGR